MEHRNFWSYAANSCEHFEFCTKIANSLFAFAI